MYFVYELFNFKVQVQVEEQEFTDEECKQMEYKDSDKVVSQPTAEIRDASRTLLQRLGALYSNTDDLSSPIHRTEGKFHSEVNEDGFDSQLRKPNQRFGKLAALANTINQWEDDTFHHSTTTNVISVQPPPKPELPSRGKLANEGQVTAISLQKCVPCKNEKSKSKEKDKIKQLKWDPKVINSLEAQGFQRRDSSTDKVSYEFSETRSDNRDTECVVNSKNDVGAEKRAVGKLNTSKFASIASNSITDKKTSQAEKEITNVKTGLVSGRAAIFELQAQNNLLLQQKPQKDPTELSLKERMKLFERNKGEALVPKAAFGMAPAISKIIQDTNHKKDEHTTGKYFYPIKFLRIRFFPYCMQGKLFMKDFTKRRRRFRS